MNGSLNYPKKLSCGGFMSLYRKNIIRGISFGGKFVSLQYANIDCTSV